MSDELEVLDLEELEDMLDTKQKEYEAEIVLDQEDEENLATLAAEEKLIMAQLYENRRKQQAIQRARYDRRADIKDKEREKRRAEAAYEEAKRIRQHEADSAAAFQVMVEEARNAEYEWVKYAQPHQWEGGMTIAHYGSVILGDGTGTGKTLTAIMSMDFKKSRKILVVVPNDVVSSFTQDFTFFAPHRNVLPLEGPTPSYRRTVKEVLSISSDYVVVTNYESLWRESKWLGDFTWDDIYIDEAHNIKNEKGLTFDALSQFDYGNCIPMTATSILNEPGDLFTQLNLIDPQRFKDKYWFLNVYCMQNSEGKWIFKPGGEAALNKQLKGRIIKRSLKDVAPDLPKQTVNEVLVPVGVIPEDQGTIMEQLKNFAAIQLDSGESTEISAIIALITRERQAATYPAGIEVKVTEKMAEENPNLPPVGTVIFKVPENTSSVKLNMAEAQLDKKVKQGIRCVVFSQFKTALVDLEARLEQRGIKVVRYDGDTSKATRLAVKRDFLRPADGAHKPDYQYDVVLANYKTGGVGLTFTEATYMLCLDEEWNPAKNSQAWARIHRIGQTEETTVDILRVEKSIDMWMKSLNEKKMAIVNGFEAEIDMVADLKAYFAQPRIETSEVKAIEATPIDTDFLDLLESF
jgi:SNF2 family DNA or RNA helicase